MIVWMRHYPDRKSECQNVIPDLHQPLPPLMYHVTQTLGERSFAWASSLRDTGGLIDWFTDNLIAHQDYGNTFVRQDPC